MTMVMAMWYNYRKISGIFVYSKFACFEPSRWSNDWCLSHCSLTKFFDHDFYHCSFSSFEQYGTFIYAYIYICVYLYMCMCVCVCMCVCARARICVCVLTVSIDTHYFLII